MTISHCLSLSLCFLLSHPSVQESQQSSADFRFYIENHTRNPDDLSRKQVRIYQLYSRTTGKHVQILGKKVNANGDDGGKYGMGELLCISPDTLDSLLKQEEKSRFWCFLRFFLTNPATGCLLLIVWRWFSMLCVWLEQNRW